jgi:hypothetical protein
VRNEQNPIILTDTDSAVSFRSNQNDALLIPCASYQHRAHHPPSASDLDGTALSSQKWTIDNVQNQLLRGLFASKTDKSP